ncbi:hypothetical protein HK096_009562, partial [Nowakowskiella sp. JEL0078]
GMCYFHFSSSASAAKFYYKYSGTRVFNGEKAYSICAANKFNSTNLVVYSVPDNVSETLIDSKSSSISIDSVNVASTSLLQNVETASLKRKAADFEDVSVLTETELRAFLKNRVKCAPKRIDGLIRRYGMNTNAIIHEIMEDEE